MQKLSIEELTVNSFLPFGFYANMINPTTEKIGEQPIEFFRDMVQQDLGSASIVSFSICRVEKRDPIIDVTEYHTRTGEGILPLDNDALIHVGPATPPNTEPSLAKFRIFRIPKGTMVVLRSGVWHHAPFTTSREPAHVLIVLPERTYANDCVVVQLNPKQRLGIEAK